MIAVIFEVQPVKGQSDSYFDIAAELRPELQKIEGFISVERFQSVTDEGKFLSLSFWQNREAIETWFHNLSHQTAQARGRESIFANYRIRVADVFRDYDMAASRPKNGSNQR